MAGDGASEPSPEDDDNIDFGITRILEGDDVQEEQVRHTGSRCHGACHVTFCSVLG